MCRAGGSLMGRLRRRKEESPARRFRAQLAFCSVPVEINVVLCNSLSSESVQARVGARMAAVCGCRPAVVRREGRRRRVGSGAAARRRERGLRSDGGRGGQTSSPSRSRHGQWRRARERESVPRRSSLRPSHFIGLPVQLISLHRLTSLTSTRRTTTVFSPQHAPSLSHRGLCQSGGWERSYPMRAKFLRRSDTIPRSRQWWRVGGKQASTPVSLN
jgi:hypothetical protein